MITLLVIQFRTDDSREHERECFQRVAQEDGSVIFKFIDSTDTSQKWDDPETMLDGIDGVIFGGSGEFHFTGHATPEKETEFTNIIQRIDPLLTYITTHDFPMLGICLGHQLLGKALGTEIILDTAQSKSGSYPLAKCDSAASDPLFEGIPDEFFAQYGHSGSLARLPDNTTLLAKGDKCKYGAIKYKNNLYGVQFHPELTKDDIRIKMSFYPEYLKHNPDFEKNLKDSPHATRVITNFARYAKHARNT
jgi:GMP synthase (glutamine-hydrolysing)